MTSKIVKDIVHISRHWDNPTIHVVVRVDGISVDMSLESFCNALADEIGNPAFILRNAALRVKILDAMDTVIGKAKEATNHV